MSIIHLGLTVYGNLMAAGAGKISLSVAVIMIIIRKDVLILDSAYGNFQIQHALNLKEDLKHLNLITLPVQYLILMVRHAKKLQVALM